MNVSMFSHGPPNHQILILSKIIWVELKKRVRQRQPSNLAELEVITKEEWSKISKETCQKYLGDYSGRLTKVIENKGFTIDY